MIEAVKKGDTDFVITLISHTEMFGEYNIDDIYGMALHMATNHGHAKTIEALLKTGISVDYEYKGVTPLIRAVRRRHLDSVAVLLGSGASVRGLNGIRMVSLAVEKYHIKILEYLLQHGADLNYPIPPGLDKRDEIIPPLITASSPTYSTDTLRLLLQYKPDVNVKAKYGDNKHYTALMVAVKDSDVEVIELLLNAGANPNYIAPPTDHFLQGHFCTTLHLAALCRRNYYPNYDEAGGEEEPDPRTSYSVLKLLLLAGANVKFSELIQNSSPFIKVVKEGEKDASGEEKFEYICLVKECDVKGPLELLYDLCGFATWCEFDNSVHLLYAAGAYIDMSQREPIIYETLDGKKIDENPSLKFIRDDQQPLLSLQGLCRREIRAHLLSCDGGNHANLIVAVPRLPIPKRLKKYLLCDVPNILEE